MSVGGGDESKIEAMMARPFYSIKDGKTSTRRIKQQQPARAPTGPAQRPSSPPSSRDEPLDNSQESDGDASAQSRAAGDTSQLTPASPRQNTPAAEADDNQQQQQLAKMILIDSFNQLVGGGGGSGGRSGDQLTSDFSSPASSQPNEDVDGAGQSLAERNNQQSDSSADEFGESAGSAGQQLQQIAATSSPGSPKASAAATQSAGSLSMSLDGEIVDSRPRAQTATGESSESGQQPDGELALALALAPDGAERSRQLQTGAEQPVGRPQSKAALAQQAPVASGDQEPVSGVAQRIGELNIGSDDSKLAAQGEGRPATPTKPTGAGKRAGSPRRVPLTSAPFSSPASKGQRTRPQASNQFVDSGVDTPVRQSAAKEPELQTPTQLVGAQASVSVVGRGNDQVGAQSGAGGDRTSTPAAGFDDNQEGVNSQVQQQVDGDRKPDIFAMVNRNGTATTTSPMDSQRPLAAKLANGDMLVSVVSSDDGKARRLVMISRDTLDSLQRFAAKQTQQTTKSSGDSSGQWWPASTTTSATSTLASGDGSAQERAQFGNQDDVQTTSGPRAQPTTTQAPRVNFGTSVADQSSSRAPATATSSSTASARENAPTTISTRRVETAPTTTVKPTTPASDGQRSFSTAAAAGLADSSRADNAFREVPVGSRQQQQQQTKASRASGSSTKSAGRAAAQSGAGSEGGNSATRPTKSSSLPQKSSTGSAARAQGEKGTAQRASQSGAGKQQAAGGKSSSAPQAAASSDSNKANRRLSGGQSKQQARKSNQLNGGAGVKQPHSSGRRNKSAASSAATSANTTTSASPATTAAPTSTTDAPSKTAATTTLTNGQQLAGGPRSSGGPDSSGGTQTSGRSGSTPTSPPMSRRELDRQLDELERAQNSGYVDDRADSMGAPASESERTGAGREADERRATGEARAQAMSELDGLRAAVPGEPLVDYPIYSSPPARTKFQCQAQSCPGGYYADPDAQCQVFHVCQNDGRMDTFLCPNGTIFSQQHFVCVWWWQVECSQATKFYRLNDAIYCNSMTLPAAGGGDTDDRSPVNSNSNSNNANKNMRQQQQFGAASAAGQDENDERVAIDSTPSSAQAMAQQRARTSSGSSGAESKTASETTESNGSGASSAAPTTEAQRPQVGGADFGAAASTPRPANEPLLNEAFLNQEQQQQPELLFRRAA